MHDLLHMIVALSVIARWAVIYYVMTRSLFLSVSLVYARESSHESVNLDVWNRIMYRKKYYIAYALIRPHQDLEIDSRD